MLEQVQIPRTLSIREAGYDEYWLQSQIYANPGSLGLGDLEVIDKERRHSSGGRLDILLKDPEDNTMYEVEVMLGPTDETHIVRTLEYYDTEKRRFPLRRHYPVLVAEQINRRFFNVIHMLSDSVPIIAIQASLVEAGAVRSLIFTTVLDVYEEVADDDSGDGKKYDRDYWTKRSPWTLESADALLALTKQIFQDPTLSYIEEYVGVTVAGKRWLWLSKKKSGKSRLFFRISPELQRETAALLDENNLPFQRDNRTGYILTVDRGTIEKHSEVFVSLAQLVKRTRGIDG